MVGRGGTVSVERDNRDDAENESSKTIKQIPHGTAVDVALPPTTATAKDTAPWRAKLRNVLFPIYGDEMTKFFLIGSIKFFVILALTITRDNKDTMVVTECGAEAIAFLKVILIAIFSLPFFERRNRSLGR